MKKISFAFFILSLCAVQGCQSPENRSAEAHESDSLNVNDNDNERKAGKRDHPGNITNKTNVNDEAAMFMKDAAAGGMMEVTFAELAAKKASSPKVKAFATQMIRDHGKANAQVAAIAEKAGVLLPTDFSAEQKKHFDHLSTLSGAEFDKQYMKMMVEDHQKTLELFKHGQDVNKQDLASFAKETVPVIERHHEQAKAINSNL